MIGESTPTVRATLARPVSRANPPPEADIEIIESSTGRFPRYRVQWVEGDQTRTTAHPFISRMAAARVAENIRRGNEWHDLGPLPSWVHTVWERLALPPESPTRTPRATPTYKEVAPEVARLTDEGHTAAEIATALGVSVSVVTSARAWWRDGHPESLPKTPIHIRIAPEVAKLTDQGLTLVQIAEHFGVSTSTVSESKRYLRESK